MEFNLADLFEQAVDHFPDRDCVVAEGQRRTFAEMEARSVADQWEESCELLIGGETEAFADFAQSRNWSTIHLALHAIMHQEPEAVETVRPDLPVKLRDVIDRCLEKNPEDRYADAGELEEVLRETQAMLATDPGASSPALAAGPIRRR